MELDSSFEISKATYESLPEINCIYLKARNFMIENKNPNQWGNFYPSEDDIKKDIENKNLYVVKKENEIICVFVFFIGEDPTYKKILGRWKSNKPYGVIHRIASSFKYKGLLKLVLSWAFDQVESIRIDTHFKNKPMRKGLKKLNFKFCGFIRCHNQTIRLAYQKDKIKVK